ncbi:MAG TPA: PD-(D/E)XK nuclease family protein, partial [Phnomibacter sp.]|nr:PD-(D/E)XK nuclease family protein [Phnomibacter sp.]
TWQHIAFVGFNALNKAEETIILRWQQQGFASLWMDADTYYVNSPEQEAGLFIRQNLQRGLRNALPVPSNIAQRTKPIQIAGVQSNTAQAKLIAPWLQSLPAGYQNAAILLANEQMLLPVLQSLPAHLASHINITMGYPLAQTAVYNLLLLYLDVQIALQNNQGRSIEPAYIQRWLMHSLSDIPAQEKSSVQDKLIKESWVYMPVKPIQALSPQAAQCFTLVSTPIQALDEMLMLLEKLQAANGLKEQPMEQAALSTAWQALQQALQQIQALQPPPSLTFIRTLVERYLGSARIAFEAGSSQGIQIMGLLESRGLHFDHILILDAAEGYLPQIKAPNSYLPQHIRQAFGLPVIEQQDAIYAYSFYRLLHYHPTLLLVYNRLVTDSSTGEPTRFIRQLKYHTNIPFEHSYPQWPVMPAVQPPIAIPLSPAIQARLRRFLSNNNPRPLSPSAINSWLYCRLQFFYQYMAGLAKPETLSNSIDAAAFGEIVHKVMEVLYQALLTHQQQNPLVTTASIAWMRTQIEAVLPAAISQAWKPTPKGQPFTYTGQWLLVKEVVTQYVQEFLNEDEAYAPFTLKELEVKFDEPFGLMVDARPQRVMLKGIIDRVDEKEGLYRMLDYKTGNDTPQFKSLEGLFERDGKHNNKAALQTLLYSWMFSKKFPEHARFQPALVALRQMKRNKTGSTLYAKQNRQAQQYLIASNMPQTLTEIEQHLRLLLEELFDPNLVFTQTNQPEKCKQCDFA